LKAIQVDSRCLQRKRFCIGELSIAGHCSVGRRITFTDYSTAYILRANQKDQNFGGKNFPYNFFLGIDIIMFFFIESTVRVYLPGYAKKMVSATDEGYSKGDLSTIWCPYAFSA
jgi:hypothetical protein